MANFEALIPFILHCEAGLRKEYTTLPGERMFAIAKKTGWSNDTADPGGATMCGVTLAVYRAYRLGHGHATTTEKNLRAIAFDEWCEILHLLYWNKWRADEIKCQQVANALVDWAWGSGKKGIIWPQRLLGVKDDGVVGPITIAAVNDYPDQEELFERIQAERNRYHDHIAKFNPKLRKFINGWRRRVSKITWKGFNYE